MTAAIDAGIAAVAAAALGGVCGLIGAILSKGKSSTSETQAALNESFNLYMESTNSKIHELETKHSTCEGRVGLLRKYILQLVRALHIHGIALPPLEEHQLQLEDHLFFEEQASQ